VEEVERLRAERDTLAEALRWYRDTGVVVEVPSVPADHVQYETVHLDVGAKARVALKEAGVES
jgi:hypothetical protein